MQDKALLQKLKEQATLLGITYSPNIGIETLQKRIDAALGKEPNQSTEDKIVIKGGSLRDKKQDQLKLVHIKLTSLDPNDRDLRSEMFTIVNSVVGRLSRVIPFNKPWYVEQCLIDSIKESKYVYIEQDPKFMEPPKTSLLPKYNIEYLPDLNGEEMDKLAQAQIAGNKLED